MVELKVSPHKHIPSRGVGGVLTWPMRNQRPSSKEAAVRSTCGKLVTPRTAPSNRRPWPQKASPWSPSDQYLYGGTPSRGTPAASSPICDTFSATVIRDTRSAARRAAGSDRSQNGSDRDGDDGPHENPGSAAAARAADDDSISARSSASAVVALRREEVPMAIARSETKLGMENAERETCQGFARIGRLI